ncbi:hypothetical protein [Halomonas elongata]|uniref:hypothetical protein n=1 Tax=Halomonas elongata TaxID=2746 RepID=UPI0023B12470|nr:hypothetical protein [Halomonas elongata]
MPRVTFIPRHVAESMSPPHDTRHLLISIAQPGGKPAINHWANRERFRFDDVETPVPGAVMFTVDDAKPLLWVLSCVRPDDLYVHCDAGMSRSAAVAKWMADRRGYGMWLHPEGIGTVEHYNRHVYRTLDAADGRDMAAYYADMERQDRMMGGGGGE